MELNPAFIRYMEEAVGAENARIAFSAFDSPASVSVRLNPFKAGAGISGRVPEWNRHGRILDARPSFTLDPHLHAGAYYVQDTSSMFVGHVFRRLMKGFDADARPVRVLDLCAAPGGKTTDLAASLREMFGDRFILVSNEVMKQRAAVLAGNVALWGDPNVVVTSDDPRDFASLEGFFDVIVADVPCSGEGMFRKDEQAREQWSEDNVALCEARQRRIVADVWPALAQGGIFIYSTCTFNRYENDGNVGWIADELGAEPLLAGDDMLSASGVLKTGLGYSLVPGHVEGEGQYCSALRKTSGTVSDRRRPSRPAGRHAGKAACPGAEGLVKLFRTEMSFRLKGDLVIAVPSAVGQELSGLESCLHVLAAGCAAGTFKGKDFVPDADLALCIALDREKFVSADVDRQTALSFLHRDALALPDTPKGYVLVCHAGLPLGFVKNLGNRCNNLHPQSRRIRMDII